MGNALSDSSRKFRKDLDSLVDAATRADATSPEAQVESIIHRQKKHPHHLICKEHNYNAFVKLAQLGSIDSLEHALGLIR